MREEREEEHAREERERDSVDRESGSGLRARVTNNNVRLVLIRITNLYDRQLREYDRCCEKHY